MSDGPTFRWEEQAVDNKRVRVDVVGSELLDQTLGLVQGQEFGQKHADKGRLVLYVRAVSGGCSST